MWLLCVVLSPAHLGKSGKLIDKCKLMRNHDQGASYCAITTIYSDSDVLDIINLQKHHLPFYILCCLLLSNLVVAWNLCNLGHFVAYYFVIFFKGICILTSFEQSESITYWDIVIFENSLLRYIYIIWVGLSWLLNENYKTLGELVIKHFCDHYIYWDTLRVDGLVKQNCVVMSLVTRIWFFC